MNGDLYFDGKKYISSSRAAKISGYVNDYIGQLCRDGKLECRMIGRSWYVSLESLISHKNTYGVLSKKHSHRTTLPIEYERDLIQPNVSLEDSLNGVHKEVVLNSNKNQKTDTDSHDRGSFEVLKNSSDIDVISYHKLFGEIFPKIASGVIAILFSFIGFQLMLAKNQNAQVAYVKISENFIQTISPVTDAGEKISANVFSGIANAIDNTAVSFYHFANNLIFNSKTKIFALFGIDIVQEPIVAMGDLVPERPSQGMVVMPVEEKTDRQKVVAKIKESFSDEVVVEPGEDGSSGLIKPVFKKTKGDEYLYVLVPIGN